MRAEPRLTRRLGAVLTQRPHARSAAAWRTAVTPLSGPFGDFPRFRGPCWKGAGRSGKRRFPSSRRRERSVAAGE